MRSKDRSSPAASYCRSAEPGGNEQPLAWQASATETLCAVKSRKSTFVTAGAHRRPQHQTTRPRKPRTGARKPRKGAHKPRNGPRKPRNGPGVVSVVVSCVVVVLNDLEKRIHKRSAEQIPWGDLNNTSYASGTRILDDPDIGTTGVFRRRLISGSSKIRVVYFPGRQISGTS